VDADECRVLVMVSVGGKGSCTLLRSPDELQRCKIRVWPPHVAALNYFCVLLLPLSDLSHGIKLNWHGKLLVGADA
jgi:hypothetical protein